MKWTILVALCLVLGARDGSAQTRTLRWARVAVTAHLDADGRLHVEERQSIVFNGEWNGAERNFPSKLENEFNLDRVSRLDESGGLVPLIKNDSLSAIDDYALIGSLLRWRSRLPTDPPFRDREITYVLGYKYGKVLIPGRESYLFDHNFGLPGIEWPIDRLSIDLSLDPVWRAVDPLPAHTARSNVRGDNVTITARLQRTGATLPAAVNFGAPESVRYALLALLLAATAFIARQFWQRERALGRFEPLVDPASIDRQWLDDHVFRFPPEVVGATWDDRTGAAEVAALIARLVQEKKLSSRVEGDDELVLTLLCRQESLKGYEATLVKSLFFGGDTTSTSKIKKHYKSRGFDPVSKIRKPIEKLIGKTAGSKGAPKITRRWTALAIVAGLILLAYGGFDDVFNLAGASTASAILVAFYLAGLGGAINYRRQLSKLELRLLQFLPAVLLILAVPAALLLQAWGLRFNTIVLAGLACFSLGLIRSLFNLAKSRDAGERLENRRRLAAARGYFVRELGGRNPALDDAWFPYVLAFGLSADADRWFKSFGGESSSSRTTFDSSSGSTSSWGSSSSSGGSWTGFGGGASGGAGASGSWAVAASSMAAGVSSPSSSSSGGSSGGGGGGGGSSGGGGGGGW